MTCAALVAAATAVPASAAFFSFASDADEASWTFAGQGATVTDAGDAFDPQVLLVDDNNGPAFPLLLAVEFEADFSIGYLGSVPFGGKFIHSYSLDGTFFFLDGSGAPVLGCSIEDGVLTSVGNGGANPTWGSTATIQGSDDYGSVQYHWYGPDMPAFGLYTGDSVGLDDAAFTLTVLHSDTGSGVNLGSTSMLPTLKWDSEGSYSGSAFFVPAPGAIGLAGIAGLLLAHRRR